MKLSRKTSIITMIFILGLFPSLTYAATEANLHFCEYPGTLRTFMIFGYALNIIKIVVPLIIMIIAVVTLSKTIFTGKDDDLKASVTSLIKRGIAGIVIFLLPTVINYAFQVLIVNDTSKFTECTTCLLDADHCRIPEDDPSTYRED